MSTLCTSDRAFCAFSAEELFCVLVLSMGKCCCAVGCSERYFKGCGLQFYRFPSNPQRKNSWIAAVNRKDWQPTEYTWICSKHFVGGKKNDESASPAYIPTLFHHVKSPAKRKAMRQLDRYERTKISKKRQLEAQLQEAEAVTVTQEIDGIGMNDVGTI